MLQFLPIAIALISLATPEANKKVRAPVPKPQETPVIEGTYILNHTYLTTGFDRGGGFGGPGGGGRMAVTQVALRSSNASITKSEIVIGGAPGVGGGYDPRYGGWDPFEGRGSATTTLTYTIDPSKSPMAIDVFTVNVRNKKEKSLGIIEVSEDRITISLAKPGADRPKNLDESEEVTLYYFKKAKMPAPPRDEYRIIAMTIGKEAEAEKEMNKLAKEGFELVNTTNPSAVDGKASHTTVHFVLKRTVK